MSESTGSGRPRVDVPLHPGKPPTKAGSLMDRITGEQPPKQETPAKKASQQTVPAPAAKPDWRTVLPSWLRQSEPSDHTSIHWKKWVIYSRLFFGPRLSQNTRDKNDANLFVPKFTDFESSTDENMMYSRQTRQLSEAKVVIVSASGGVGKTTVSTLLGAQRSEATGRNVIIYDGDSSDPNALEWYNLTSVIDPGSFPEAPEDGSPDESLDDIIEAVPGETNQADDTFEALTTLRLSELLDEDPEWVPQYSDLVKLVAADDDSNVMIIHAAEGKLLDAATTTRNVQKIKPACHTFIADTQPGTFDGNDATSALVKEADIVIVPGLANKAKGLRAVEKTLNFKPYNLRTVSGRVAGHVLIVISGVKPKDFNARTRARFATRYSAALQQIILIPHSQYLEGEGDFDTISKIKIDTLDPLTRFGVSYFDRTISKLAIRLNRHRRAKEAYDKQHMPPEDKGSASAGPETSEKSVSTGSSFRKDEATPVNSSNSTASAPADSEELLQNEASWAVA